MPTTYSDLLRLAKQATGENNNTWGDIFNANTLELIEEAIAGVSTISVTASDETLTTANGIADESRAAVLKFTGTPGATRTVTIPSVNKVYMVHNDTSDSSSVIVTTGSGNTLTLTSGQIGIMYCDGTEVIAPTFLEASNNLSDLASASTARTNLGLTDLATYSDNTENSLISFSSGNAATEVAVSAPLVVDADSGTFTINGATDSANGTVELATNAEVVTGTDTTRAVTPAGLTALLTNAQTIASSGYITLGGGLIIQWGQNASSNGATISFPLEFPTAVFVVVGSQYSTGGSTDENVSIKSQTTTGFNAHYTDIGSGITSGTVNWIAIGN